MLISSSFTEHWVRKFEAEYEECYLSVTQGQDGADTEAEFESLLAQHQYKENLEEKYASKKFDASVPRQPLLDTSVARNKARLNPRQSYREKTTNTLIENSIISQHNAANSGSPKLSNNLTNTARSSKVTRKVCLNDQTFLSEPPVTSSSDQNQYEDVQVFKKRTKKKNPLQEGEMFVSEVKNISVKYSNQEENLREICPATGGQKKTDIDTKKAPFEKFQNCLFSLFTCCVPWTCMKKVYWKSINRKQEDFSSLSRRNRRCQTL